MARKNTETLKLKVKMFGGFELSKEGEEVVLGRNTSAKFTQLLEIIWLHAEDGVSRNKLLQDLFGAEDLANISNSLNNLLYQMRKQMVKAGLPDKDYVVKQAGRFIQDPYVEIEVDTSVFRQAVQAGDAAKSPEKKYESYRQAFQIYQGVFLPELVGTTPWVQAESAKLKEMYGRAITWLGSYLKSVSRFEEMYSIFERANQIYPAGDWQADMIDALIGMNHFKEAYQLYEKTLRYYREELAQQPSAKLQSCLQKINEEFVPEPERLADIRSEIMGLKDEEEGAYCCSYPSFIDAYHILSRNIERTQFSIYMMLCTLVDYEGKSFSNSEKLKRHSAELNTAIIQAIRGGDAYCKYSESQYLLLLLGTMQDGTDVIAQRIRRKLKELAGTKAGVICRAVALTDLPTLQ